MKIIYIIFSGFCKRCYIQKR